MHPPSAETATHRPPVVPLLLFAGAMAFWPVFTTLTCLDARGVAWLRTSNAAFWVPVALLALLGAVTAPLFSRLTPAKKVAAAAGSVLLFAAAYGACVLVGVRWLGWDD